LGSRSVGKISNACVLAGNLHPRRAAADRYSRMTALAALISGVKRASEVNGINATIYFSCARASVSIRKSKSRLICSTSDDTRYHIAGSNAIVERPA
jgi:hypothetical protein